MHCVALLAALTAATMAVDAIAAPPSASSGAAVRYRWTAGRPVRYRLQADIKLSAPGDTEPVKGRAVLIYQVTPGKAGSGGATPLTLAYRSLDTELLGTPIIVPDDQAKRALNRSVTVLPTGKITRVAGGGASNMNMYIPGVEPGRLYALLFPVVFPDHPLREGEQWTYTTNLLGTETNPAPFTATYAGRIPVTPGAPRPRQIEVMATFQMDVDLRLDASGKPAAEGAAPAVTRKGRISGQAVYTFDPVLGRLEAGNVVLAADMTESHPAEAASNPAEAISNHVDATIKIGMAPDPPAANRAKHRK